MTDRTQKLMDQAYARWQDQDWSKQDFWDQLDPAERIAVFAGNLNQQVCNGGFAQWYDNAYATDETVCFLVRLADNMNTETSREVSNLLSLARDAFEDYHHSGGDNCDEDAEEIWADFHKSLDPLDTVYYRINNQFLAELEIYLAGFTAR